MKLCLGNFYRHLAIFCWSHWARKTVKNCHLLRRRNVSIKKNFRSKLRKGMCLGTYQCDQIAGLFFNIWPFTSMKICPKVYKVSQSRFKILPNCIWTFENCPRLCRFCQSDEISPNLDTLVPTPTFAKISTSMSQLSRFHGRFSKCVLCRMLCNFVNC